MTPRPGIRVLAAAIVLALLVVACREITAPDRSQQFSGASKSLLNASGIVVVYPDSMRGWVFYNDQTNAVCPIGSACRMAQGPATPPLGSGSAELYDSLTTDGKALILADYAGTRFDQITDLHYSTYRQTANTGNNLAISLQFNVDYDLGDAATGYQGRLVFEPYVGIGGNVPQNTWQTWDAKSGKWWGTRSTVTRNGASVANPCVQATPCTWAAVLAAFPNVGVHSVYGAVVLKAGSGWPGFRGNVDKLTIRVDGVATTFDFELAAPLPATAPFPDTLPPPPNWAYLDSLPHVPLSAAVPDSDLVVSGVILVTFKTSATTADKQFVRDSLLNADLLGAWRREPAALSTYYFKVRDNPSVDSLIARDARVDGDVRVLASEVLVVRERFMPSYRKPTENPSFWSDFLDPLGLAIPTSSPANGLNLIRAPLAWGCTVGNAAVRMSIYDNWFGDVEDLRPNLTRVRGGYYADPGATSMWNHGERVAAVLAAAGDNGRGMTGVMWNAHMEWMGQYADSASGDTSRVSIDDERRRDIAIANLVRIGEVSDIINYSVTPTFFGTDAPVVREEKMRQSRRLLLTALTTLAARGRYPMVVVAAGNNGIDARLAGAPSVAAEFPSQVVVVGGAATRQAIWEHSNTGAVIDLYAPSVAVGSLNLDGVVVTDMEGTSLAAPLVAGTLGLILSFDPRLQIGGTEAQAAKLKEILISGSNRSQDRINGKPVLDAYEVLRRAASEANAPLCGNRVYRAGVDVIAERGAALETLIHDPTLSQWDYGYLNVLHDGRTIQYAGGAYEYMWGPSGSWVLNPAADSAAARERDLSSAAYNGLLGYNHGRTVAAGAYAFTSDANARVRVAFQSAPFNTSPVDTVVQQFWFQGIRSNSCDRFRVFDQSCYRSAEERHGVAVSPMFGSGAVAAVSPLGDYVVVAVNFSRQHVVFGPPRSCTQWELMQTDSLGNDLLCADRIQADTSDHVEFFKVSRQGGGPFISLSGPGATALPSGRTVNWIALSETAGEMVLSASTTAVQNQAAMSCGAEEMVWIPLGSDGFAGASAVARHPGQTSGCEGYYFGGGTFAPLRGVKVPPTEGRTLRNH